MNKHVAVLIYALILLAGTAYLVEVKQWSMWTFLLVMCFLPSTSCKCKCDEADCRKD